MGQFGFEDYLFLAFIVGVIIYFLPFIVSLFTGNTRGAVFVINLFLGWSIIGWVWALVWAVTSDSKQIIINNHIMEPNDRETYNSHNSTNIQQPLIAKTEKSNTEKILDIHSNQIRRLKELNEIFKKGAITKDEFEQQKQLILHNKF